MEQLLIIIFGLSTLMAAIAFIAWLTIKNRHIRNDDKIYNLPNEIPGEGVDIRLSEQPYYEC